jgi:RNA polymerase sigma-70 factor (ECF subfamily)
MTTTETTSAGSTVLMGAATVEAPSSRWAVPRLAALAALLYMSPYHFARLFKCSTGVTPHRFVKTGAAGKEGEMGCTESVVERTHQEPGVDELRGLFPRKAIDPDAALVERLRRQDAGAAEALVGAYWDRVYRLAIRITGNASDAEEVVQDALWTVSRRIDTFRGAAAFGTWLYRITVNTANQKLRGRRSKRNEVSWEDLAPSFDDKGQHAEVVVDWSRRLKDPAIEGELRSVLGGAIDELPADYRTAFLLHDVEGLSHPEIAETLHIKLGTVKSRVHRTRLFLRRRLADYIGRTFSVA